MKGKFILYQFGSCYFRLIEETKMISEVNVTNQNKEDLKTKNDKNKKIIK